MSKGQNQPLTGAKAIEEILRKIENLSKQDIAILIDFIMSISLRLCIHQVVHIDGCFESECRSNNSLIDKRELYDLAISICQMEAGITGIKDGYMYQTNSLLKPIKTDKELNDMLSFW